MVQEYKVCEADKALTITQAHGIQRIVFQQGRLAYLYDAGREIPVGCVGYHRITKREALANWLAYLHAAIDRGKAFSLPRIVQPSMSLLTCSPNNLQAGIRRPSF